MARVLNYEERAVKKNREEETGVAKGFKEVQTGKLEDGRTLMSEQKPNSENVGGRTFKRQAHYSLLFLLPKPGGGSPSCTGNFWSSPKA